jgi:hypothetical protein
MKARSRDEGVRIRSIDTVRNGRSHNESLAENLKVELDESMAMSGERVHLLTAINPGRLQGSQTLIESVHLL